MAKKNMWMYHVAEWLLIIGGLNWGLGIFNVNLVTLLFGSGVLTTIVYALVGVSALYLAYHKLAME
jgi:uncharacterized membrane protein YuzA (DUF378 family)